MQAFLGLTSNLLFWAWLFVGAWVMMILAALAYQRWDALTISILGLLAALMVVSAIMSRRNKAFYPDDFSGNHEPHYRGRQ